MKFIKDIKDLLIKVDQILSLTLENNLLIRALIRKLESTDTPYEKVMVQADKIKKKTGRPRKDRK
jgi:hypothetical protein